MWWHSGVVAQRCGGTGVWCSSEVEVVCGAVRTAAANCRESRYRRSRPRRPRGSCCDSGVLASASAHFQGHSRACPSTPLAHRPALSTWGRKPRTNFLLGVSPLSAGATLHWSKHAAAPLPPSAAKDKGQRPAQLELSHQSALSTSPCRCWDQCACRPPSPSSGRCRSVGGRAGCAAQAWRWQVRGQSQSVRPGGACDKGAVDRGTSRWLAPVDGVVHPPAALLHAHATPLRLGEQPPLGCILGDVFGQDDVAVRGGACEFARSYPHSVHQTPVRGWGREGVLHRYSNSSSKYFSEYSISWAVMMLRTRVELVR